MTACGPAAGRARALPRDAAVVGYSGIVLGVARVLVAIPPIEAALVRLAAPPRVPRGAARGLDASAAGERRLGFGAVAAGLIGIGARPAATRSSTGNLDQVFTRGADRVDARLRDAARLRRDRRDVLRAQRRREHRPRGHDADGRVLGDLGRGQGRVAGSSGSSSRWPSGGLLALVHAFFAIHLRADQIVGGTAVNFLALGITGYFFVQLYHGERHRRASRRSRT